MSLSGSAPTISWTDSHCHVHDEENPEVLVSRAKASGISRLILVGTDAASSSRAAALAARLGDGLFATIGLHPHDASEGTAEIRSQLEALDPVSAPRRSGSVVAVGECGLDYFYDHSPRELQREAFIEQIDLAKQFALTLVVHTRDAWEDTFAILRGEGVPENTVIHCFTGGVDEARACLDLGCYVSFSGIVTFKTAEALREAARFVPDDRILVETDAPFLAPVPHRGRSNEPAWVAVVGEAVAELRSSSAASFAALTVENTERAFQLAP